MHQCFFRAVQVLFQCSLVLRRTASPARGFASAPRAFLQRSRPDDEMELFNNDSFRIILKDQTFAIEALTKNRRRMAPTVVWYTKKGKLSPGSEGRSLHWNPTSHTKVFFAQSQDDDPVLTNVKALLKDQADAVAGKGKVKSSDLSKRKSDLHWHFAQSFKPGRHARTLFWTLCFVFAPWLQALPGHVIATICH